MGIFSKQELDAITADQSFGRSASPVQPKKTSGRGGWLTSLISEAAGTVGGVGGFLLGGPLGAAAGAAGLGGLGSALEQKIRDDKVSVSKALGEGALEGIFAGLPLGKVAKGAKGVVKGGAKLATKEIGGEVGEEAAKKGLLGRIFGGAKGGVTDRATSNLLGLTPSQSKKLLDAGIDPTDLSKLANRYGKDAAEIIGRTGNKGSLQQTIKALEKGIAKTTSEAGRTVKISGDDFLKALKSERRKLARGLGNESKIKQMDRIIVQAQNKYKNGVTAKQARQILKEANQKFGKSIIDDSSDAVVTSVQKLEANSIRKVLKETFPGIGKALDDESSLIQLREILKSKRAKDITGGFKTGKIDITRPGTLVDPILNSRVVSRAALGGGGPPAGAAGAVADIGTEAATKAGVRPLGMLARVGLGSNINTALQEPEQPSEADLLNDPATTELAPGQVDGTELETGVDTSITQGMDMDTIQQGLQQAALKALAAGDSKGLENIMKVASLFESMNKSQEAEGLNSTAAGTITDLQNGLANLRELSTQFAESDANNPLTSWFRGRNPYDTDAQALQQKTAAVKQVIGKALEGGVLRKEDEIKYAKILPKLSDTDAVAQRKIETIATDIERKLMLYQQNLGGGTGGIDINSLVGATQ